VQSRRKTGRSSRASRSAWTNRPPSEAGTKSAFNPCSSSSRSPAASISRRSSAASTASKPSGLSRSRGSPRSFSMPLPSWVKSTAVFCSVPTLMPAPPQVVPSAARRARRGRTGRGAAPVPARELHGEPQRPVARAEREPRTERVGDLEALEDGLHARPLARCASRDPSPSPPPAPIR